MTEREWRWKKLKDNSYVNLNIPVINEYLKANSYTITRLARAMGVHESLIKTCFEKRRMGTALYKRMCSQLGAPCSKLTTDPEDSMYKAPIKIHTPQKIDKNEYAAEPVEPKNYVGSRSIDFNGQSLYNYLKNNKIAQTWVSEKLGKDKTCVNKYILHNKMPYESYVEICKILNVSEDKFLGNVTIERVEKSKKTVVEKPIVKEENNTDYIKVKKKDFEDVMMQLDELMSNISWFSAVFQKLQEPMVNSIEQIEQLKNRVNNLLKE